MLWVNGLVVIDHWVQAGTFRACVPVTLAAATLYPIKLDYAEQSGQGQVRLKWQPPGEAEAVVPGTALSH
jgi:PA14 domain-containing protein